MDSGNKEPKALIFLCHGYAMECSITMSSTAIRLVKEGFAVYGIDYQGHGKSAGLDAYIENFDDIINDCSDHFTTIREKEENKGKKRYLLGKSMGGPVALLLHTKIPAFWHGAILAAPICEIADDIKPSPAVGLILKGVSWLAPTLKSLINRDVVEIAFKEPEVRPPFIVLHGEEDGVTDQEASIELYIAASGKDKTLKLYPGMWHGMLYGEPLENVKYRVFGHYQMVGRKNLSR